MDIISFRVTGPEFGLILRLKEEMGVPSFQHVMRTALFALEKNPVLKEDTKKYMEQLRGHYAHDLQREVTKFKLTKIMLVGNQMKLLDRLRRQGIPEAGLQELITALNEEMASVGIDYKHTAKKPMTLRKSGAKHED